MQTFQYVKKDGGLQTFQSADSASALTTLGTFGDANPHSGVITPPIGSSVASDSSTARAETKSLKESITDAENNATSSSNFTSGDEAKLRTASKATTDELKSQRQSLAQRAADEESMINQLFAQSQAELEGKQQKEFAGRSTSLIIAGGYLGGTQSHEGSLANLAQQHRQEVSALTLKKLAAIQEARSAYEDRDFKLADKIMEESKAIEAEIVNTRKAFADKTLDIQKEKNSQENKVRDDARTSLNTIITNFGGVGLENLDRDSLETLGNLADTAGIPRDLLEKGFRTLKEKGMEATQNQRDFQRQMAEANLAIREASLVLSQSRAEKTNVIDSLTAGRLGLPRAVVGLTEEKINSDFQTDTVPSWFKEAEEQKSVVPITASDLKTKWNKFRNSSPSTGYESILQGLVDNGFSSAPVTDNTPATNKPGLFEGFFDRFKGPTETTPPGATF